jgi:5-methylthioadenosine/S-adenosylhomocysteine deaminase
MSKTRLVRGRWIVTGAEGADAILANGAVVVEGNEIRATGPWETLREQYPDAEVLGSDQYAVLPGLINAHHHSSGVTALQQGIPDGVLEPWLLTLAKRRRTDLYLSTVLSAARLLRTGVTTVVDVHSGRGTADEFAGTIRHALSAYEESGIRVAFAAGMTEESHLVWGEDEAFLASLPGDARAAAEQRLPGEDHLSPADYFDVFDDLWREYENHPRLSLWFAPPGPQWCSDDFLVRIAEAAARYDTGIQTHLLESIYEKYHGPRAYGRPTLLHLQDLGILNPRVSFAHGVWLTEAELEVLAQSGASVSHNPSSNLRLRAGIAPLNAMLAAGVNVAVGMDGTTLNDDEDMFTEMRLALRLNRPPHLDDPAPSPGRIFELATGGGARLLRAETRLGRLAPGFTADLVLVKLDRLSWPWVAPEADPLDLLLTRAQARDVDTVMVEGEVVLREGQPTRIDVAAAGQELAEQLAATPFPADAASMVETLLPHVEDHYRAWGEQELDPFTAYNSRR